MLGIFSCFCCRQLTCSKINSKKEICQEHYQSVKRFGPRSQTSVLICGSKLFAKFFNRRQKSPFERNELNYPFKRQSRLQQTTHFATSFLIFEKKGMIFHENRLPADDSHEISCTQVNRMSKSRRVLATGGKQRSYGLHMVCFEMVLYHNKPH